MNDQKAMSNGFPLCEFIFRNYHNFNARALRNALVGYWELLEQGGKMFWTLAGAMSSAQLGISLAPAIRAGLIHGISTTGANLEESLFRLVAHKSYKDFPEYRYFTKEKDTELLEAGLRRVTDTSIPEDEAFRAVESVMVPLWEAAEREGRRQFWHEYFYELVGKLDGKVFEGNPEECWLLAAAERKLPLVVPGYEDSTFGNIFASYVKEGKVSPGIARSGIEYMVELYEVYQRLSGGPGLGFFQIGGGIAGDFPICVVPSLRMDLEVEAKPWAYFCQISDSTTSYGSYSGATPNEKITWDKLTKDTPMFVIESDATIVAPLLLGALLECKRDPEGAKMFLGGG
ncbi:MAG TPA: deoxyhypusine synthase family protein [Kiritimatiellia bacterium]|mgnify:CR=1 FL=1|nr:deoxyhypusine synthase family protein [Kiritimatiellia bacterium]